MWADICTVQLYQQNETSHNSALVELATQAHKIREAAVEAGAFDKHHPNRANGFMNLGVVLGGKDPHEAIRLHEIALSIREGSTQYTQDQIHGLSLNYLNIGRCWWMTGELDKAAQSFERSLAILKEREQDLDVRFPL